jgi:hypothetical protein
MQDITNPELTGNLPLEPAIVAGAPSAASDPSGVVNPPLEPALGSAEDDDQDARFTPGSLGRPGERDREPTS